MSGRGGFDHSTPATAGAPALVILLIDCSESALQPVGPYPSRLDAATEVLRRVFRHLIDQSKVGGAFQVRYHISIIGYGEHAASLLPPDACIEQYLPRELRSLVGIDWIRRHGLPRCTPQGPSNPRAGFLLAEFLLQREVPLRTAAGGSPSVAPAPVVLHLTSGVRAPQFNSAIEAFTRIQRFATEDGPTLVANVLLDSPLVQTGLTEPRTWSGVSDPEELGWWGGRRELFALSSRLPQSRAEAMGRQGYAIQPGRAMLFSIEHLDVIPWLFAPGA